MAVAFSCPKFPPSSLYTVSRGGTADQGEILEKTFPISALLVHTTCYTMGGPGPRYMFCFAFDLSQRLDRERKKV